jgi:hypothetical protein
MRANHQASVQRWLQQHCESSGQVAGGLVIAAGAAPGQAHNVAEWPAGGGMTPPLSAAAQAAVDRSRPVVASPAAATATATHNRVISLPLRVGDRTLGAVALAVQADDGDAVNAMFKDLELASVDIGQTLQAPGADTVADAAGSSDAARVLRLQDLLLRHASLADGALALATELAPLLGCDRVMLGVVEDDKIELLALSNSADFHGEQDLLRLAAAAMQEAVDQGARVAYPPAPTARACIVLAHAELHARSGQALASVPLVHGGRAVGAVLAEWRGTQPPDDQAIALLDSVACMLGPLVALSRRAERSWKGRSADLLNAAWHRVTRRNDPLPKAIAVLLVAALALVAWLPVRYHVGAPARIEGAVQRVVAAPMDGYLHKSHVRPGDSVRAGDLLVELADQDLLLEQRKWEGALAQHENGFAAALARADRAQFVITQGKAGEARAQLDLVRQQLARTRLLAPIAGIVIKGDLGQALGAPVQRGDALLTLAPAERYRLIVEVDERDIASVQPGQGGQLALASLSGDTLAFVVERVTPVATVRDGRNAFAVEARLREAAPLLRPGLEGVAKIEVGERSIAWIWSHRAVDWLRLALWSWAP